jgi:hypothetical protein
MPFVMTLVWEGVTRDNYDVLCKMVSWESLAPESTLHPRILPEPEIVDHAISWEADRPGGLLDHVVSFDGNTMYVTDIWEKAEDCHHFVDNRLLPVASLLGIVGQPCIEIRSSQRWFAPGYRQARAA